MTPDKVRYRGRDRQTQQQARQDRRMVLGLPFTGSEALDALIERLCPEDAEKMDSEHEQRRRRYQQQIDAFLGQP